MKRVNDIIPIGDIDTWTADCPVVISAPTGAGKTTWVLKDLIPYAESIGEQVLILTSRRASRKQIARDIKELGTANATVLSYQKVSQMVWHRETVGLEKYSFIVCDEFHFFTSDASFNNLCDLAFTVIMHSKAVKIFMSATGTVMESFLRLYTKAQPKKYTINPDWSFIGHLEFYDNNQQLEDIINQALNRDEKVMVFMNDMKNALSLYKTYKDKAIFACSQSNKEYRKYMDEDRVNEMIQLEQFDADILICTSAFDVGMNVNDDSVRTVIIDMKDSTSLLQCLGRKRLKDNEQINLYIHNIHSKILGAIKSKNLRLISDGDFFLLNGPSVFRTEKCPNGILMPGLVYVGTDDSLNLNRFAYYKCKSDIGTIDYILSHGGWVKCWGRFFGCPYTYKPPVKEDKALKKYLEENANRVFYEPKDREPLIQALGLKRNGRPVRGLNALNGYLKDIGIGYVICSVPGVYVLPDGSKKRCRSAWILTETKGEKQ